MTIEPPTPQHPRAGAQPLRADIVYPTRGHYRLQPATATPQRSTVVGVDRNGDTSDAGDPQIGGW